MNTRRDCLIALTGFAASGAIAQANLAYEVIKVGPKPKLIHGENGAPDKVDFGHGLLVPMTTAAFHTLWEGDDRWMTYGHGFGPRRVSAMAQAEEAATGTMKLYLLTLAFAPEKLMPVEGGGWRLKSGNVADLVKGEIELPGRPLMPTTDYVSGMMDSGNHADVSARGDTSGGGSGLSPDGEQATHATTGWLIWKREVTLDFVRNHAVLL